MSAHRRHVAEDELLRRSPHVHAERRPARGPGAGGEHAGAPADLHGRRGGRRHPLAEPDRRAGRQQDRDRLADHLGVPRPGPVDLQGERTVSDRHHGSGEIAPLEACGAVRARDVRGQGDADDRDHGQELPHESSDSVWIRLVQRDRPAGPAP